ncbi:M66 family metalloprotease [Photobacterium sp. GB-3]|uniref:M66 family metalloprotease n=1 Tax=Photobacterium sp. GB-3 TaxID=2022110 RepID=UPI000D157F2B|nr:M66 family metalloprotease [Photobacterium sp. GB-3]PSV58787.1 carbohydrate-binding protein [Photobacterium sp. GB-3]
MKKKYLVSLLPVLLMAQYGQAETIGSTVPETLYFNKKALPSDTQGTLQGSVSVAQSVIMQTSNKIENDRQPHLVSLRRTLVLFEPHADMLEQDEVVTVTAKNKQNDVVYHTVMRQPQQLPQVAGKLDKYVEITKPSQFSLTITSNHDLSDISGEAGITHFKALLAQHDTVLVKTGDGHWAGHFILPDDKSFNNKKITFISDAGYNSQIEYTQGRDTISRGNQFTYQNIDGVWYGESDMAISRISYSDKAYSAVLPAEAVKLGLSLTFTSGNKKEGTVSDIKIGANTSMILNAIDIGLLTEPRDQFIFIDDPELHRQYFQSLQISKLIVNPYESVHLKEIILPDGRLLQGVDPSDADGYGSDSHYRIARELISSGINSANYGVNSSKVRPASQWNIEAPYHATQVTVNNSIGNYTDGLIAHGMLGSYAGVASVVSSTGNEFSHEVGHELGVGAHYPGGFTGAIHKSSTEVNSTWGWDVYKNIFIPNFTKGVTNQESCYEGECVAPFEGHSFGFGTMSGGQPLYPKYNAYTLHAPYELSVFQDFVENKANFDPESPTGYSKWDHVEQVMKPWTHSVVDDLAISVVVSPNESLGPDEFGPESHKFYELFEKNDLVYVLVKNHAWIGNVHLPSDIAFEGKTALVQVTSLWNTNIHYNDQSFTLERDKKYAFTYANGQWVLEENSTLGGNIDLIPYKQGVQVTTLVGYYDPQKTLPSYIYPALHGAYGNVYLDNFTASTCQLDVLTQNGGTKTFNLYNRRLQDGHMNRFHINIESALKPYRAEVSCGGEVLNTMDIVPAKASLKASIVTTEAGKAPVITGVDDIVVAHGDLFAPLAGVTATDDYDGDVTASIVVEGTVDTNKVGHYTLTYKAYDSALSESVVVRKVEVFSAKPVLEGISDTTIQLGDTFDAKTGITAKDAEDGDITANIIIEGEVNTSLAGNYTLNYRITDSAQQTTEAQRVVTVESSAVCENTWSAQSIYVAGDEVSHNGVVWLAGWWTKGEEPGTTGEWGVWKQIATEGCTSVKPEVTPPAPGEYPTYQAGTVYQQGDIVRASDEQLYQCKPWPNSGWCSSASYAPASSAYWQDAWTKL